MEEEAESMKILVTAFLPFGGESVNPAQKAVELLPEEILGAQLVKVLLPVTYAGAPKAVLEALNAESPDAVVCIGQAGGRCAVTPERVAINYMGAQIADNDGKKIRGREIQKGAPAAFFSTLPVEKMAADLKKSKLPAAVSNTAGTFICNLVLYRVLQQIEKKSLPTKAGFIHVPYLPEQVEGKENVFSLPLEKTVKALTVCIEAVIRDLKNYVYIVRCADGSLYTGWTNDLDKRMAAHAGSRGAKYTKSHGMQELVYFETFSDRTQAMQREWEIKQLSRKEKLRLIGQEP